MWGASKSRRRAPTVWNENVRTLPQTASQLGREVRRHFRGAFVGIRRQNSFVVHFVFAGAVAALAFWLQVSKLEACVLLLCVFLVLAAEMFNSALETLARAIDSRYNPYLADGLDIASAAVLTSALALYSSASSFLDRDCGKRSVNDIRLLAAALCGSIVY